MCGIDPVPVDEVRDGDVVSYPGPPRRQRVAEALDLGSSHIGIFATIDGVGTVVELGPGGCRARPLAEIVDRFDAVHVLGLPVDATVAARVADEARSRLVSRVFYAPGLARLTYLWANFRALDHYAVATLARMLHPVVAGLSLLLGAGRMSCSSFVHDVVLAAGVDLGLRFDRPAGAAAADRSHRGIRGTICAPSDYYCSPLVTRHLIVASAASATPADRELRAAG